MKSMDERRAAIKKQLRGGKRNTLRELSEAIGEELERTRAAVRRMCELGEVHQECDGLPGQRGVYRLTRSSEMLGVGASESIDCKIIDGIWPNEVEEAKSSSGAPKWSYHEEYSRFTDSEGDLVESLKEMQK